MYNGFIGEVRVMASSYAPVGWLFCDGKEYSQNDYRYAALFNVIGRLYGGDQRRRTFAVPDLRQYGVCGAGGNGVTRPSLKIGEKTGEPEVTLTTAQMPRHDHTLSGRIAAFTLATNAPAGNWLGVPVHSTPQQIPRTRQGKRYNPDQTADRTLHKDTLSQYPGEAKPHENRQPYLTIPYLICYEGEFITA